MKTSVFWLGFETFIRRDNKGGNKPWAGMRPVRVWL